MTPVWPTENAAPGPGDRAASPACPGPGRRPNLPTFRPGRLTDGPMAVLKRGLLPDGVTVAQGILVPFV